MLGLLGALDPYKKQLQEARTRRSKMGTPHSKPLNSKTEGLWQSSHGGGSGMEVVMMSSGDGMWG